MARSSKVEACIFCNALPCECNKKAKPDRAKPSPKAKPEEPAKPKSRFKPGKKPVRVEAPKPKQVQPKTRFNLDGAYREPTQDDLNDAAAIRNIADAGLLPDSEIRRFERMGILNPPMKANTERKLLDWKERHAKG